MDMCMLDITDVANAKEGDTVIQIATSSYLNHVVANDLVLLPSYVEHGTSIAQQETVRRIYALAFPGRQIRFIDTMNANWVGGGAHCATLSEPEACVPQVALRAVVAPTGGISTS